MYSPSCLPLCRGKESIGKVMLERDLIASQARGIDKWLPLTRIKKADEVQGEILVEIHLTRDNVRMY